MHQSIAGRVGRDVRGDSSWCELYPKVVDKNFVLKKGKEIILVEKDLVDNLQKWTDCLAAKDDMDAMACVSSGWRLRKSLTVK